MYASVQVGGYANEWIEKYYKTNTKVLGTLYAGMVISNKGISLGGDHLRSGNEGSISFD